MGIYLFILIFLKQSGPNSKQYPQERRRKFWQLEQGAEVEALLGGHWPVASYGA